MAPSPEIESLDSSQRRSVVALCSFIALSRWFARSQTIWEWDEILLCLGMRDFDIAAHHPHPPGFPLFIALGKLVRPLVESDFRALQTVNLFAAALLAPAVFHLARQLGFRFRTSLIATAITAFLPNVWFYGGTAFSDIASLTASLGGAGLVLSGRTRRSHYWYGVVAFAIAAGIRPQTMLIAPLPFILTSITRGRERRWEPIAALFLGAAIVAGSYGAAAHATGSWSKYLSSIKSHASYIESVDSFLNPSRPGSVSIFNAFFFKQYAHLPTGYLITLLVLIAVGHAVRHRVRAVGLAFLLFAPFCLAAASMLDRFSVSRYAVGYVPLFSLLCGQGIAILSDWMFPASHRRKAIFEYSVGVAMILWMIVWFLPSLLHLRSESSPTFAAMQWIRAHLSPRDTTLFVATAMDPFREYFLSDYRYQTLLDEHSLPLARSMHGQGWILAEGATSGVSERFTRSKNGPLWKTARHRYFETFVVRADQVLELSNEWMPAQGAENRVWRSMGSRGTVELSSTSPRSVLKIRVAGPKGSGGVNIQVRFNGAVIDRFSAPGWEVTREYRVSSWTDRKNRLELESDTTMPDDQGRLVGLRLYSVSYRPARR